jgi:histone H3/H4
MKNKIIKSLTNQITYNRLLRATSLILKENVFEFNDVYMRNMINQKLKSLYSKAKTFAIKDYRITILPFDKSKPHYMEVHIEILFDAMIYYVEMNINNADI